MTSRNLDDEVKKLEELLTSSATNLDDENEAACIFTHIETNILGALKDRRKDSHEDGSTRDMDEYPPVSVVVYTARRYVYPTLLVPDVPRLLVILANVDAFRREAVRAANEILKEASVGKGKRKDKRLKALAKIGDEQSTASRDLRYVFLSVVVMGLCRVVRFIRF